MAKTYYSPFFPPQETSGAKGSTIPIVTSGTVTDIIDRIDVIDNIIPDLQPIDNEAPSAVTGLSLTSTIVLDSDGSQIITLVATWVASAATDLNHYVLAIQENGGGFVEFIAGRSATRYEWKVRSNQTFGVKLRAVDHAGNLGPWSSTVNAVSAKDSTPPAAPINLEATAGFNLIFLSWVNPVDTDLAHVEVYSNTVNNSASASRIDTVNAEPSKAGGYTHSAINTATTIFYWLKAVDTSGNASSFSSVTSATTVGVDQGDFATGLAPVAKGTALPNPVGYTGPELFFNSTDKKLYRYNASTSSWTTAVATVDLSGTISETQIANSAISVAKFATGLRPVEIVSTLPTTGNVAGRTVVLSTDGKLYRYNGTAFTASVPTTDLLGTITQSQVANSAISLAKFATGLRPVEIVSTLPTTGNVTGRTVVLSTDGKLYRYNGTAFTASVPTTDLLGTITQSQVADSAISVAKFATGLRPVELVSILPSTGLIEGRVVFLTTDGKLYRYISGSGWVKTIPAGDLTGQLVETQIGENSISTGKIQASAITTDKIEANSITAGQIKAGAIGATEIAANSIVASKMVLGDTSNMVTDSNMEDVASWFSNVTFSLVTHAAPFASKNLINTVATTDTIDLVSTLIPIEQDKDYYVGSAFKPNAVGVTTYLIVDWWSMASNGTTTLISSSEIATNSNNSLSRFSKIVKSPSGARVASIRYSKPANATTTYITAVEPIFRKAADASLIVDGSITALKIAVGSISADRLEANSITAGQIKAGAIGATEIAANSIVASKMVLGDTSNMVPDPNMEDAASWYSNVTFVLSAHSGVFASKNLINTATSTGVIDLTSALIPIERDKQYYISSVFRPNVTGVPVSLIVDWWSMASNGTTTLISSSIIGTNSVASLATMSSIVTSPSNARVASIRYSKPANATATYITAVEPIFRKAADASLIVDGSITALKIAVGSISADRLEANSITAGQIKAGAIGATEIAANSIVASKMVLGDTSNMFPDPDLKDISAFNPSLGAGSFSISVNVSDGGNQLRVLANAGISSIRAIPVTIDDTKKYYFSVIGQLEGSNDGSKGAMVVDWFSSVEAAAGYLGTTKVDSDITSFVSATRKEEILTPPAGAKSCRVSFVKYASSSGATTNAVFSYPVMRTAADASLIVDGSITALKIAVGSISADRLESKSVTAEQIFGGTITADEIATGTITAANIKGETITGDKISGRTIAAENLVAGSITAFEIKAGTITGDKIDSFTSLPATLSIGTTGFSLGVVQTLSNSQGSLVSANSTFSDWSGVVPANYTNWSGATITKVAGETYANAMRIVAGAGALGGAQQLSANGHAPWTLAVNEWIVIEADIKLNSGTLTGAGVTVRGNGTDNIILSLAVDKDVTDAVIGAGTAEKTYRYRKLVKVTAGAQTSSQIYLMNHWTTIGSTAVANDITWFKAGWRYASTAEIAAQRADINAANPAAVVNANSTLISPGKIQLVGTTTLTSWMHGGDNTLINGGVIAANTILANKLYIGARNVQILDITFDTNRVNQVTWTSGFITWTNDSGGITTTAVSAGLSNWSSGTTYIWWYKGGSVLTTGGTPTGNPNDMQLAVYRGGANLVATYGKTIIDGTSIKTGTIDADKLNVISLSAITANIGTLRTATTGARTEISDNVIKVFDENNVLRVKLGNLSL